MACPHLDYRSADDEREFDHERPYCGILESFVSPMRADICNDRFEFDHAEDCPVFALHHDESGATPAEATGGANGSVAGERDSIASAASDGGGTPESRAGDVGDVEAVVDGDGPESDGSTTD